MMAFEILTQVNRYEAYSNLLLPKMLGESTLERRDKGFVTELVYGSLRMQGRHDWILSHVSDRPWVSVDTGIVDVARLGVHQLFEMRVPTHAAVSATVELARKVLGESKGSYVNALMRKVSARPLEEWMELIDTIADSTERLAIKYSHPEWIVSAYFDLLKEESEVIQALAANNVPASPVLVSWPGRSTQSELVALGGTATRYSPFGATIVDIPSEIGLIRDRRAGIQDEGSQLVAHAFAQAAMTHDNWLDLCAGPGGKAALISSLAVANNKEFVANEISSTRARLVEQVIAGGAVWLGDGRAVSERGKIFGAVIADVPCTGIGALRRRPEIRWRRKPSDLSGLAKLQSELLDSAFSIVEVGGVVGYATCSPHLAETKVQVNSALKRHSNLRLVPVDPFLPSNLKNAVVNDCMQLWTHRHGTDAMFLALFERVS
jgi:16S rRNA (cytosine967-C5)-methyltransferase